MPEALLAGAKAVGDGLLVNVEDGGGRGGVVFGGEVGSQGLADPLRGDGVALDALQL